MGRRSRRAIDADSIRQELTAITKAVSKDRKYPVQVKATMQRLRQLLDMEPLNERFAGDAEAVLFALKNWVDP